MSSRTLPSMTLSRGGSGRPSWSRPSTNGASSSSSHIGTSRGYAVAGHRSNPPSRSARGDNVVSTSLQHGNPRDHLHHHHNDRNREQGGRNQSEYREIRSHRVSDPRFGFDDDRDRNNTHRGRGFDDRGYNDRRPMVDHGNRFRSENHRSENHRMERHRYDDNYFHESKESSSSFRNPNSSSSSSKPSMTGPGGSSNSSNNNYYNDDRRRPMDHSVREDWGKNYRHSMDGRNSEPQRGMTDRDYEEMGMVNRDNKQRMHQNDHKTHQRRQQEQHPPQSNDYRDHQQHSNNEDRMSASDGYPSSRYNGVMGRGVDRDSSGDENFRHNEYNAQNRGKPPPQKQLGPRWQPPPGDSHGHEPNERPGTSDHRHTEMGDARDGNRSEAHHRESRGRYHLEESRGGSSTHQRDQRELSLRGYGALGRGSGDVEDRYRHPSHSREEDHHFRNHRHHGQEGRPKPASWVPPDRPQTEETPVSRGTDSFGASYSSGEKETENTRKRQREDHQLPNTPAASNLEPRKSNSSERIPVPVVQKPIDSASDTIEKKPIGGSLAVSKKPKLLVSGGEPKHTSSSISHPSSKAPYSTRDTKSGQIVSQTKPKHIYGIAKNGPVKASSSQPIKKHQLQAKPKAKPSAKLGILMRWLKPKAKPVMKKPPPPLKILEDASKTQKIAKKSARPSSPPSKSLVTDSSEGSSIHSNAKVVSSASNMKKQGMSSVPAAIVTKHSKKQSSKTNTKHKAPKSSTSITDDPEEPEDEWDSEAASEDSGSDSDSESDIDGDQVLDWAAKKLGVPASPSSIPPIESKNSLDPTSNGQNQSASEVAAKPKSRKLKIRLSSALKLKLTESIQSNINNVDNALSEEDGKKLKAALKKLERRKKKHEKLKALSEKVNEEMPEFDQGKAQEKIEEDRRKREEAKPLTAKEIRKILRDDTFSGSTNNFVRRSRRQPNMALVKSKPVRMLVDKLKYNDTDVRVLKMKKYINDPNTPCAVMDAILNAMEENSNCEALYIQNFNEGMRDDQVIHLLRILQLPSCKIWCLNIGENYNVSVGTWEKFTKGLIHTKITHMYASEHTITPDMKEEIRFTIRQNRNKHDMHINPNNLDVIIQCTHCWWNPINAKVLRPFLKKKGYEHVLQDKEAQGLQGTQSMAPTT